MSMNLKRNCIQRVTKRHVKNIILYSVRHIIKSIVYNAVYNHTLLFFIKDLFSIL